MKIYIAPDKFKGTLSAYTAADTIASVINEALPQYETVIAPMADGGEGTAAIAAKFLNMKCCAVDAADSLGRPCQAQYFVNEFTREAFVDCSTVSGLALISPEDRRPMEGSTYSLGVLINNILDSGVTKLHIGIGGSATSDGGAGMLQALGVKFIDINGKVMERHIAPQDLPNIAGIDLSGVNFDRLQRSLVVLSDVDVPMVSDKDEVTTLTFAPQKGFIGEALTQLVVGLRNWRNVAVAALPDHGDEHYAGAAGGLGFAFGRVLGVPVRSGAEYMVNLYGLINPETAMIITGEGSIDDQTMCGKVVGEIVTQATKVGIPVVAIGGRVTDGFTDYDAFTAVLSTTDDLPGEPLTPEIAHRRLHLTIYRALPAIKKSLGCKDGKGSADAVDLGLSVLWCE